MFIQFLKKYHLLPVILLAILLLASCKNDNPIGKWENGIIPYYLKGNFAAEDIAYIEQGMAKWEAIANVDFQRVTPRAGAYQIEKIDEDKWQSSVGENNSTCYMIFGNGQDPLQHIIHELGHGLGLLHEHQRPDRDNYIDIYYSNILSAFQFNFDKIDNPLIIESDYAYDYHSVMHYGESAFSSNGAITIEPKDSSQVLERELISDIDAAKVQYIYGLPLD